MNNECDNHRSLTCKLDISIPNEIVFCPYADKWLMKITSDGILFNREKYPNSKPDDFAKDVIEILENQFTVKFERKHPADNRE